MNNYCIGREINSNFSYWNKLENDIKAIMLAADLSYHSSALSNTAGHQEDYGHIGPTAVKNLERILFCDNTIGKNQLFAIYLDFLTKLARAPKPNKQKANPDNESEEEKKREEKEERQTVEIRNIIDKEETEDKHVLYSERLSFKTLLSRANLSSVERSAFDYIVNYEHNSNNISFFSPRGITHLANRASFKLLLARIYSKRKYNHHKFEESDISTYPDLSFIDNLFGKI